MCQARLMAGCGTVADPIGAAVGPFVVHSSVKYRSGRLCPCGGWQHAAPRHPATHAAVLSCNMEVGVLVPLGSTVAALPRSPGPLSPG